jgi:hypothetical protein
MIETKYHTYQKIKAFLRLFWEASAGAYYSNPGIMPRPASHGHDFLVLKSCPVSSQLFDALPTAGEALPELFRPLRFPLSIIDRCSTILLIQAVFLDVLDHRSRDQILHTHLPDV